MYPSPPQIWLTSKSSVGSFQRNSRHPFLVPPMFKCPYSLESPDNSTSSLLSLKCPWMASPSRAFSPPTKADTQVLTISGLLSYISAWVFPAFIIRFTSQENYPSSRGFSTRSILRLLRPQPGPAAPLGRLWLMVPPSSDIQQANKPRQAIYLLASALCIPLTSYIKHLEIILLTFV